MMLNQQPDYTKPRFVPPDDSVSLRSLGPIMSCVRHYLIVDSGVTPGNWDIISKQSDFQTACAMIERVVPTQILKRGQDQILDELKRQAESGNEEAKTAISLLKGLERTLQRSNTVM